MAEEQQNQIIVIEPVTKTVNDLLEAVMEKDQAEISPFQNADEAVQYARQLLPCMLVLCIQSNNDIPSTLNILKQLKQDIKQGYVKTLLVSQVKNPQLQKLIGEFGVTDYVEEPIPARTLMFKANLQLKAVDTTRRQMELKKRAEEKIVFKIAKKNEEEAQSNGSVDVPTRNKPALQLASDTFLIKNSAVRKQAKKFVVELDGPDPSTGEWVTEGNDPANPGWRWKPHDKEDEPGSEEGDGWVAAGEKPQFKPVTKKWQLSSEKPALYFKKKSLKVAEKIAASPNGEVVIAEDSPAAEENLRNNLKKAQRLKKKKQAEAAGIPFEEEEEKAPSAKAETGTEEEDEGLDPILKAKLKAKSKAKRANDSAATQAESPAEEGGEAGGPGKEEAEGPVSGARQKLEKLRKARKDRKKAAITAGLPLDPADEDESNPTAASETPEEESSPASIRVKKREKKPAPKGEGQLLDFLQKKKRAHVKPGGDPPAEETDSGPDKSEASVEEEAENRLQLKKRQRVKKAAGAVEELKELPAEAEPQSPLLQKEKPRGKAETSEARPEIDNLGEKKSETKLQMLLNERKRRREAKRKALLEEIQAEAEPTPEEIDTFERKKKAKAEGTEIEEEPEEKRRNERLEKLRRKRAELDALEQAIQEEEKNGNVLHAHSKDAPRGMNVWDTDEAAPADESPAEKLLKRLKKESREKAAPEASTKEAGNEPAEPVDNSANQPGEKRKKKARAATQAEGLEEIFSENEEVSEDLYGEEKREGSEEPAGTEPEEKARSKNLEQLRKNREAAGGGKDALAEEAGKKEFKEAEAIDLSTARNEAGAMATAAEKLKKKSESSARLQSFLERRKKKKKGPAPEPVDERRTAEGDAGANPKHAFLGIFVTISDSFGLASERKLLNIFRSIESCLEGCAVALTEPRNGDAPLKVLFASSLSKGSGIPVAECRIETFLDTQDKPVAQLALRMLAPRTNFAEDELKTIERTVHALKPLVFQWLATEGKEAKVA